MTRRPRIEAVAAEEPAPEADRLEGFPHPRDTSDLYGQSRAEDELVRAFQSGRMHHGWLLAGPEGVGKATLAYRFARYALASETARAAAQGLNVDPELPSSRQTRSLSHPGLMVIRRPWNAQAKRHATTIPVEEVRRLKSFLQHSADAGSWRVVIVDRAEEMNASAANALLKSLEEPPRQAIFLLVAAEPGRLLPTIHSRCRRLELPALSAADLDRAIAGPLAIAGLKRAEASEAELLAGLARGSVRRALTLAEGGGTALYQRIVAILSGLPRLDGEAVHKLADSLAPAQAEPELQMFVALLQDLVGRGVRHAAGRGGALPGEAALFDRLIGQGTGGSAALARWAALWETIARQKADVMALNLDRKSFVLETFWRLEAAQRQAA